MLLVRSAIDGGVLRSRDLGETVTAMAVDPAGKMLAAGTSSGRVTLLRAPEWRIVQEMGRHEDAVTGLALSDSGEYIASTSGTLEGATVAQRDQSLRLWDVSEHRQLFRLPTSIPGAPVRFDRDGKLGLLDNGKVLRIDWSVPGLKSRACKYVQQDLSFELRGQLELPAATCPGA
jgi:WD40 repeat protein